MSNYIEYKTELKQKYIHNEPSFTGNLEHFLLMNPNIKIITTIVHKPYHATIIYEEKIIVKI